MKYELFIGERAYSSWSLRAWLLFDRFGLPVETRMVPFDGPPVAQQMSAIPPARTVPTLRCSDGAVICDSLAIAEELASREPSAGIWPDDPLARATARTLAAEMHSGFAALRRDCPMNLRRAYTGVKISDEVHADVDRIEEIWDHARDTCGGDGPWLCGQYSVADAFFAPVAARIAGYGIDVSEASWAYVATHLADPSFRRWRAMGLSAGAELERYNRDYPVTDWPGPPLLEARAITKGPSENAACPYSGKPVTHFMKLDDRVFGFCNPFCRDKTVADAAAWPAFSKLYQTA